MDTLSDEDEAVASDLDLHALIASQNPTDLDGEPFQSAEEVIKEIDDLMQVNQSLTDPFPSVGLDLIVFFIYFEGPSVIAGNERVHAPKPGHTRMRHVLQTRIVHSSRQ